MTRKLYEPVAFSVAGPEAAAATASTLPLAFACTVDMHQIGHVAAQSNCNDVVNAPARCGKSILIQGLLKPTLKKRYNNKGFGLAAATALTAFALGKGVGTIHSLAGVVRGKGSAAMLHKQMSSIAAKRWQDVQVMPTSHFVLFVGWSLDLSCACTNWCKSNSVKACCCALHADKCKEAAVAEMACIALFAFVLFWPNSMCGCDAALRLTVAG